jgi:hypothetical protein
MEWLFLVERRTLQNQGLQLVLLGWLRVWGRHDNGSGIGPSSTCSSMSHKRKKARGSRVRKALGTRIRGDSLAPDSNEGDILDRGPMA